MKQLLFQVAQITAVLYLLSLVFSVITGKKPGNTLEIKDVNDSIKKMTGVWWIFIPIVSLGALLYNIFVSAIWFLAEVIGLIVRIAGWFWNEVIIAGGYLLFRIFWHYLVKWPWRILLMAFGHLKNAFTFRHFIIGLTGVALSLMVSFAGSFAIGHWGWHRLTGIIFTILSVLPLGIAISAVILEKNPGNDKNETRKKFITHLLFLIATFFLFIAVQLLLFYIGSLTSYSYTLSSLLSGGNIFTSFFIIMNAGLLLFSLSALPSFSMDYTGSNRELLKHFGKHLLHKWPQYMLAAGATLIPAYILCLLPCLLSQGAVNLSDKISQSVYSYRESEIQKRIDKHEEIKYAEWLDFKKTDSAMVKKQMETDTRQIEDDIDLARTRKNASILSGFFSKHNAEYGAAPVGALMYAIGWYNDKSAQLSATPAYESEAISVNDKQKSFKSQLDQKAIPDAEKNIKELEAMIGELNTRLENVCKEPTPAPQTPPSETAPTPPATTEQPSMDNCELQRKELRDRIEKTEDQKRDAEMYLSRSRMISDYLKGLLEKMSSRESSASDSGTMGFFFLSLWMCIIMGFAYAFVIPVFALTNHSVYKESDGTDKYYLVSEIEAAHQRNRNQPLLGLLLLPVLFPLWMYISGTYRDIKGYASDVFKIMKIHAAYVKMSEMKSKLISLYTGIENNTTSETSESAPAEEDIAPPPPPPPAPAEVSADTVPAIMADTTMPYMQDMQMPATDPSAAAAPAQEAPAAEAAPSPQQQDQNAEESPLGRYLFQTNGEDKVFLFSQPDNGSEKVGYMNSRVYVTVTNISNNYGYIEFNTASGRKGGWVDMSYLTKVPGSMIQ